MKQLPQNFKDGRHNKNGVDNTPYTGCCDAARDGFTGNKFDRYQEVNNKDPLGSTHEEAVAIYDLLLEEELKKS